MSPPFGIPVPPQAKDEGGSLPRRPFTDYVGNGVTATDDPTNNRTIVTIPGGGSVNIQDEGVPLTARGSLNFTGNGVTATDDPTNNRTQIYIPGAVGGTTNYPATIITPLGGDDSPQLQAAFDSALAAGGGEIIINGILRLKTRCQYVGNGLVLRGIGFGQKSGVVPFDSSYAGIDLISMGNPDITVDAGVWNKVYNLYFGNATVIKTAGAGLILNCSYSVVQDCIFVGQYECILIAQGQIHIIRNCQFWSFKGDGIRCRAADGAGANPMRGNEYRIHDCIFWGSEQAIGSGKAGINWEWIDPLYVFNTEIMMCDIGIKITNARGNPYKGFITAYSPTEWGWISNCVIDEYTTAGILIDAVSSSYNPRNIYIRDTYVSTFGGRGTATEGPGIHIKGACNNIQISGGVCQGNGQGTPSIKLEPGMSSDDTVRAPYHIHMDGVNTFYGVTFVSGYTYDQISMKGMHNGGIDGIGNPLSPSFGIDFGGASFTNSIFSNNSYEIYNNTSGLISSASRTSIVHDNVGWQPVAAIPSVPSSGAAINNPNPFGCTVYISSGSVSAIIVNGITTGLTGGAVYVPQGGTIQLTYSVAPSWTWVADK